ncbi:MAG: hypothetical protein Q9169_007126, partial [Polycauliona sp. 2 TL-2023]
MSARDLPTVKNTRQARPIRAQPEDSKRQVVVVHNKMMPTPNEDWTLYGDETVTVKYSAIRERRASKVCRKPSTDKTSRNTKTTRPTMLPTPPSSNPEESEREKKPTEHNDSARQDDMNSQRQSTTDSANGRK